MSTLIIETSVSGNEDWDAHENADGTFTGDGAGSVLRNSSTSGSQVHEARYFDNVTIANSETIISATLELVESKGGFGNGNVDCDIGLEDVDDADDFATTADILGRLPSITSSTVNWTETGLSADDVVVTESFHGALQEVVDRAGWASGNAICVLLRSKSSGTEHSGFDQYNGNDPAILVVSYDEFDIDLFENSIPSGEAFGSATVATGAVDVDVDSNGIASGEAFGSATVTTGAVNIDLDTTGFLDQFTLVVTPEAGSTFEDISSPTTPSWGTFFAEVSDPAHTASGWELDSKRS